MVNLLTKWVSQDVLNFKNKVGPLNSIGHSRLKNKSHDTTWPMPAGKSSLPQKDKILRISPQQDMIASLLTLKKNIIALSNQKMFT